MFSGMDMFVCVFCLGLFSCFTNQNTQITFLNYRAFYITITLRTQLLQHLPFSWALQKHGNRTVLRFKM